MRSNRWTHIWILLSYVIKKCASWHACLLTSFYQPLKSKYKLDKFYFDGIRSIGVHCITRANLNFNASLIVFHYFHFPNILAFVMGIVVKTWIIINSVAIILDLMQFCVYYVLYLLRVHFKSSKYS